MNKYQPIFIEGKGKKELTNIGGMVDSWGLQLYYKRDYGTGVFLWILQNF